MRNCPQWKTDSIELDDEIYSEMLERGRTTQLLKVIPIRKKMVPSLEHEKRYLQHLCGNKSGLVDSSKEISRGLSLLYGPTNAILIHLIRDPKFLFASARRRAESGIPIRINRKTYKWPISLIPLLELFVAVSWLGSTVLLYSLSARKRSNYCILDYELFIKNPKQQLLELNKRFGIKEKDQLIEIGNDVEYQVHHLVGGNRMANTGRVKIDQSFREVRLGKLSIVIYWILCAIPYRLILRSSFLIR